MIISFETKGSNELDAFLDRYNNPHSMSAQISRNSFLEFSISRFGDLVIISQKHLFDVVAKWVLMCAFLDMMFAYAYNFQTLFFIGSIFLLVSGLWLSKYVRFYALKLSIKRRGHNEKIEYVNEVLTIEKILLFMECQNGSK